MNWLEDDTYLGLDIEQRSRQKVPTIQGRIRNLVGGQVKERLEAMVPATHHGLTPLCCGQQLKSGHEVEHRLGLRK